MRIASYVHVRATMGNLNLTGVPKHINNMLPRLASLKEVSVDLLAAYDDLEGGRRLPTTSALAGMTVHPIPFPRRLLEWSWILFGGPSADRWARDADWVYCPAETYVPVRQSLLAATIHCVNWFEPELPWYNDPGVRRTRWAWRPRLERLRRNAHLLLPVSEFLRARLAALFRINPERMVVVGNGVEPAYYEPGALPDNLMKLAVGRPYCVVIGELNQRKNAEGTLAVAAELHRRAPDFRIFVVGASDETHRERAVRHPNVFQLGYVSVEQGLPALLAGSVALLFLSRYETFGIPAAEAMAAGTPAVVSHHGALPEVVGKAGIVVDPTQPAAIADMLCNLERDSALRNGYVAAGRKRAEQFRWEACVQRLVQALRDRM